MIHLPDKLASIVSQKNNLGQYGLPFDYHNLPIQLSSIAKEYSSCVLEIGTGWGEFTLDNAQQNPGSLFIGVEKKLHRVKSCIERQQKRGIANIYWLVLDVEWFFSEVFLPDSFQKIIINFPDPWPKKRHHKHRFLHAERIKDFQSILKQSGVIEIGSDSYEYMRDVLLILESDKAWRNLHGQFSLQRELRERPKTYFQGLAVKAGLPTYFLQFQLVDNSN